LDYRHMFVDMSNVNVSANWTSTGLPGHTCVGALGDSFAAGTTDGPGDFDFRQGTNSTTTNEFWNWMASFISNPSPEQIACQAPKPILINSGAVTFPVPWTPNILPLQVMRLGQLWIIGVPGEFTTMSGRRLRNTVLKTLKQYGEVDNNTMIVIAGLSNAYSHYIATYEEYQYQRYEAASTLFGQHTLAAYQQLYSEIIVSMATGQPVPPGPTPPDLAGETPSFQPGVIVDGHPIFGSFGEVKHDVNATYSGGDTAYCVFWGANPRNDFRTQDTFLTVEQLQDDGTWMVILNDGDWETRYHWERYGIDESLITVTWLFPADQSSGSYRLRHFGNWKSLLGNISPYQGTSSTFAVQ